MAQKLLAASAAIALAALPAAADDKAPAPVSAAIVCAAAPDLATAAVLKLTKDRGDSIDIKMKGSEPCVLDAAQKSSRYTVIALPASDAPFLVTVESEPVNTQLFAPRLMLLDSKGAVLRSVARDAFLFHGDTLHVVLRSHAGEAYLVIASDPDSAGQTVSHVSESTSVMPIVTPGAYIILHTGSDESNTLIYSLTGEITVSVDPMPKS
jgi:Maltose operon periplasmic protein precursor (MalM)